MISNALLIACFQGAKIQNNFAISKFYPVFARFMSFFRAFLQK